MKIVEVRRATDEELPDHWRRHRGPNPVALDLADGRVLVPACDPELNGPGYLLGIDDDGYFGFDPQDETERETPQMDLSRIGTWLEEAFADSLAVYEYDSFVRLTNGSAGMYVDVSFDGDELHLEGHRYGESVDKRCVQTKSTLIETLRETI